MTQDYLIIFTFDAGQNNLNDLDESHGGQINIVVEWNLQTAS